MLKCNIELQGLDLDFDEDLFMENLAEFISSNRQTRCAEGKIAVDTARVTIVTYLGGGDRRVNGWKMENKK